MAFHLHHSKWIKLGNFTSVPKVGLFDVFEGREGRKSGEKRTRAEQLTSRGFDEMCGEIEKEMAELKSRV